MTWIRLDDSLPQNPKISQVGPLAAWIYTSGLCYCGKHLTDGNIPIEVVPMLTTVPQPHKHVAKLVNAGLWLFTSSGYQVVGYLDFQSSRDQVMAEREKAKKRRQKQKDVTP